MIFITIGTNEPFDRLLEMVERLTTTERIVVQCGSSGVRPSNAKCVSYLPFEEVLEYMGDARVVVSHAGVGSILAALGCGKRPVVVPRLHRLGDAVDDHQLELGRKLADAGLVTLVEEPSLLDEAIRPDGDSGRALAGTDGRLAGELRDYLSVQVAGART